jgi:hypothetical protein
VLGDPIKRSDSSGAYAFVFKFYADVMVGPGRFRPDQTLYLFISQYGEIQRVWADF